MIDLSKTEARRDLFLKCIDALLENIDLNSRMDIRDRIAALALIDRVIAREKPDDADKRGSTARKYEATFQASHGAGRRADTAGRPGNGEPDAADAGDPAAVRDEDDDGERLGDPA